MQLALTILEFAAVFFLLMLIPDDRDAADRRWEKYREWMR
jgi:hypothetical protein